MDKADSVALPAPEPPIDSASGAAVSLCLMRHITKLHRNRLPFFSSAYPANPGKPLFGVVLRNTFYRNLDARPISLSRPATSLVALSTSLA